MGFSRREYWSGLPIPSPGDLPDPGIKLASPKLAGRFFTTELLGKAWLGNKNLTSQAAQQIVCYFFCLFVFVFLKKIGSVLTPSTTECALDGKRIVTDVIS